jgi:serine/threonine-protein kinase RsbT
VRLNDKSAVYVPIESASDLVKARQEGRALANQLGFSPGQATLIASVISELARNIVTYAHRGQIVLVTDGNSTVQIRARDDGPGIPDVTAALEPGYSTSSGLGLGLPGVRRIADDFDITSGPSGTIVNVTIMRR